MTPEKNNFDRLYGTIMAVLFILLFSGSVFIVSGRDYDLFDTYRKYWTIAAGLVSIMFMCAAMYAGNGHMELPVDILLKSIICVGALETIFALAQFFRFLPTYNRYYAYTGSFENPAVFAMLLSVCVPIAVFYALNESAPRRKRLLWWMYTLGLLVFISFSESRTGLIAAVLSSTVTALFESERLRKRLFRLRTVVTILPLAIISLYLIYCFKEDSAYGRILIWRVAMDMVKEHPLFGLGPGGFTAKYMEFQADFFLKNPESGFLLLADNVNNPFNEYLSVLVNYGLFGLAVLSVLMVYTIKRICVIEKPYRAVMSGFAAVLLIWSFFSYPFSMPFVWVVALLILFVAYYNDIQRTYRYSCPILLIACIIGMVLTVHGFIPEREWKRASYRSQNGDADIVLNNYPVLYDRLSSNYRFLYNYGAELHYYGHYEESLAVLEQCSTLLNDYDVQMLIGDCMQHTGDTIGAIERYRYAGRMVPSKFLPLYFIMNLYIASGDTIQAVQVADHILHKKVKIDRSKAVQRIIREASEIIQNGTTE